MTGRPELLPDAASSTPRIGVVTAGFCRRAGSSRRGGVADRDRVRRNGQARPFVRLQLPEVVAEAWRIHPTVQDFEAHQAFAWEYRANYDAMPPLLRGRLDESKDTTAADYDAARRIADQAQGGIGRHIRRGRRIAHLLGAGRAAKGIGLDRRSPFQPALDPDGRALRQRSGLCRRWQICRSACR